MPIFSKMTYLRKNSRREWKIVHLKNIRPEKSLYFDNLSRISLIFGWENNRLSIERKKKHAFQPRVKFTFRQLITNFSDFQRNNSVYMKKKKKNLKHLYPIYLFWMLFTELESQFIKLRSFQLQFILFGRYLFSDRSPIFWRLPIKNQRPNRSNFTGTHKITTSDTFGDRSQTWRCHRTATA